MPASASSQQTGRRHPSSLLGAGTPSPAGTILLRYGPKGSTPETGDMT
ncbi:hypothetical protein [Cryobacterium breve]